MSKIFINFTWDQLHCFHVITFMPCIRPSFFYTDFRLCISGSRKSICPKKNSLLALQQSVYDIEHLHTLRTVQMFFHSHTAAHTRSDHNTSPGYSHSTHTGSACPRDTHLPAETFRPQSCKTLHGDNTVRRSHHTSALYKSGDWVHLLFPAGYLQRGHSGTISGFHAPHPAGTGCFPSRPEQRKNDSAQFAPVEEKADDFPVFFRLITQIFSVIAVELDKTLLPYISGAA